MGGHKELASGRVASVPEGNGHLVRLWSWIQGLPFLGSLWARLVKSPRELERFLKFAVVGTIGAGVDFAVLNILKLWFESVGLGEGWSTAWPPHEIQLVLAATFSFAPRAGQHLALLGSVFFFVGFLVALISLTVELSTKMRGQ